MSHESSPRERVTGEERRQAVRQVARILEMQQMACAGENERLDVRQPLEQQLLPLMKTGIALLPDDGEHRLSHAPRLVRPEGPLPQGRQLMAEERIGVGQRLIDGVGNRLLEDGTVARTTRPAEKRIDGLARVTGAVQLEGLGNFRRAWHRHQRRLEERDGLDDDRNVQRELKSDAAARGVSDDVGSVETEMRHQRAEDGRFPCEREGRHQWTAARIPGAMVANEPVATSEGRLLEEWAEPVGASAVMDQHDGFPGAADLVLQLDAIEDRAIHVSLRVAAWSRGHGQARRSYRRRSEPPIA